MHDTYTGGSVSSRQKKNLFRTLLIGRAGLRAGWSLVLWLLIFATLAAVVMIGVQKLFHGYHPARGAALTPGFMFVGELCGVALVMMSTWAMSRIERRPIQRYGYAASGGAKSAIIGALCAFLLLSLLIGVLRIGGWMSFDKAILDLGPALRYGAEWAIVFILLGIFEEGFIRGYAQFTLARGLGFWWAAALLSLAFAGIHKQNLGESPIGLLSAGLVGMVFCFSLWRSGSIWWAIGFHAAWDWGEAFFYGVPNSGTLSEGHLFATHPNGNTLLSGGGAGPEGSIFIIPILALAVAAAIATLTPKDISLDESKACRVGVSGSSA